MNPKSFYFSLVIVLSAFTEAVFADQSSDNFWYGGITWFNFEHDLVNERLLESRHDNFFFDRNIGGFNAEYGQRRVDFGDTGNGYKYYVGVAANDSWDWEFGVISFDDTEGTFTAGEIDGASFDDSVLEAKGSLKGWFLHFQYRFDLEPLTFINGLELVPKLGFWGWDSETETVYETDLESTGVREDVDNDRGYDEYYGIGLSYEILKGFHIRVDADKYVFGSSEANLASVTLDFPIPRIPYVFF